MFSRLKNQLFSAIRPEKMGFFGGFLASLSISVGYVPVAVSFGLVAVHSGLNPLTAILMSALLFAGASQFVLVSLLASGAGYLVSLGTVLMMNARHVFYGPTLMRKFDFCTARTRLPLLAWGLTDEVFAASLARLEGISAHKRERWYMGLQVGAYIAWTGGTAVGAASGTSFSEMPAFLQYSVQFVLPALFMALLLDMVSRESMFVVVVAAGVTIVAPIMVPTYLAIPLAMVGGATASALWKKSDG